jgi:hypothetical protein
LHDVWRDVSDIVLAPMLHGAPEVFIVDAHVILHHVQSNRVFCSRRTMLLMAGIYSRWIIT